MEYGRWSRRRNRKKKKVLFAALSFVLLAGLISCAFFLPLKKNQAKTAGNDVSEQAQPGMTTSGLHSGIQVFLTKQPEEKDAPVFSFSERERPRVKGIYITGPMAGSASFQELVALLDETELNTMVIDVKDDRGEITFQMDLEEVKQKNACISYIQDIHALMELLKEHNIYTIARIPCFKDPVLASSMPELALKKEDGTPITDGNGLAWVNPYCEEVWEYLVKIAKEAGKLGFDEVQFDYVRFPIGEDAREADYGVDVAEYSKQQAIENFLTYAVEELHPLGIPVTADVFGTIIGSQEDVENVGQDYVCIGEIIDVVSPMVYPSHYAENVFGIPVPDARPYDTVFAALFQSGEEMGKIPVDRRAVVRPWLQAFTASWVKGHISYGGEEIRQQIQAVYDAGYEEWILWNAANRYSAEGLLEAEEG